MHYVPAVWKGRKQGSKLRTIQLLWLISIISIHLNHLTSPVFTCCCSPYIHTSIHPSIRFEEARVILEELLQVLRAAASADSSCSVLPREYRSAGSLREEAEQRALRVPPVLIRLALTLEQLGLHGYAEPLYQEAVTTYRDVNGVRHSSVAEALCLLAPCIAAQSQSQSQSLPLSLSLSLAADGISGAGSGSDRYDEAVRMLAEAESIFDALGIDHPR
jgi:tetratricopeptide (TPR) repeat protein